MIIESAGIQLSSQRQFSRVREESESLTLRLGQRQVEATRNATIEEGAASQERLISETLDGDSLNLSPLSANAGGATILQITDEDLKDAGESVEVAIFEMLMEELLGRKVNITEYEQDDVEDVESRQVGGGDFGMAYSYRESITESESTGFRAEGSVRTSDGREIKFELGLDMDRSFTRERSVDIRAGTLIDPLVINFSGDAAQLTDTKFAFDLDADGTDEQISFLSSNSGFLAFDRNSNGRIDNGSELFGPSTNDGFAELAVYDEDGNGFIDEGDGIYNQLSLYNKTADGQDQLRSLKDTGVGAIYLDSVGTQFSLNQGAEQLGQVRETGIYINEDGSTGTVQEIDLSV
jgi:hypothetical protein